MVGFLHRVLDLTQIIPVRGTRKFLELTRIPIGICVSVNVNERVRPEVDGIRARSKTAIEIVWIKHLHSKRFPTTCRPTVGKTRPSLADSPELFLDLRNKFAHDGVAIRSEVGGIDGIRIVIIGIGVLHFDDDKARKIFPGPLLIEMVGLLLFDLRVPVDSEPFAIVGRVHVGIGRLRPEAAEVRREMTVVNHQGVMGVGVLVESIGEENIGADEHRLSPEGRQQFTLDPDVLDVF